MQYDAVDVVLQSRTLQYPNAEVEVKLLLPIIEKKPEKPVGAIPFTTYFQRHYNFRRAAQPDEEMLQKKAMKDLKGIEMTFPMLKKSSTILAMAAWFVCLCTIDDLVESMDPLTAEKTLNDCCELLQRTRVVSMNFVGNLDAATIQNRRRSTCYTVDTDLYRQAVHIAEVFRAHLVVVLGSKQYKIVSKEIGDVFWAMKSEIAFRRTRCNDANDYMKIRAFTIGLTPFFTLLRCDQGIYPGSSEILTGLEGCVRRIVGMHNDLVGLEKDLACWEWMNYAIVYSGLTRRQPTSLGAIQGGVTRAISISDDFARHISLYSAAMLHKLNEREAGVASALIAFIEYHWLWATHAKRYKA